LTLKSNRAVIVITNLWKLFTVDLLGIFKEIHWSYIPPFIVYLVAGISGFNCILTRNRILQDHLQSFHRLHNRSP
jgi:hypothetical protein